MTKVTAPAPAIVEPGIIIRASVNLGEQDRLFQFETAADRDATLPELNALCDKMRRAGDRQRALSVLPGWKRNRENDEYILNENRKRLAQLEARLAESDRQRIEKAEQLEVERRNLYESGYAAFIQSGRRGDYKPQGHDKNVLEAKDRDIAALQEGRIKEYNEAAVERGRLAVEIRDGERKIEQWDILIAEQEANARDPVND